MGTRATLRRWHVWLGWLIAVPMLFWTLSGVVMVLRPIEEVRGTNLLREPAPMTLAMPAVPPSLEGLPVESLSLEQRSVGPRWVITTADGKSRMADPVTGGLVPDYGAADAAREVEARYTGDARVVSTSRVNPSDPPKDLRREMTGWLVEMSDGTHFYVDSGSGAIAARRTAWWRFYDFMWGLHIMDLETREDTHHAWIVGFGALALVSTLMALVLLPMTGKRKRNGSAKQSKQN
ncbi:PepSY domain-containing protein [Sphingomonas sp. HDW15A]|uniref:PepSY domain-containing protein n=1 Tax=Sphingomonas sp. HDW15A TaxID=2714942 RepID=UPI00140848AE|nr:PepSY domain-containing protein [Sphingomonas sp. HDW15A]QIK96560.1 PepSY domain-containing protein [Sphingomonas sp. HDW15A]